MENTVETLSFEQALAELEQVVQQLEEGTLNLNDTVGVYQRGHQLAKHCQKLLSGVELRVEQLITSETGEQDIVPFET